MTSSEQSGDPRVSRSRAAILQAARTLLMEKGPSAVTHALAAERAGVARATVYRHWPRVDDLLGDAMATVPLPFFDSGSRATRSSLTAELTAIARQLGEAEVRAVTTTLAQNSLWDAETDRRRTRFADLISSRLVALLVQARDDGAITLRLDPNDAAAVSLGPLYYRSTIEHRAIDATLIDAVVDALGEWALADD